MTVYIEKPAVNLREELASLRNRGGYQEQQFYFDSLVTNGTFDSDTDWTKGTGWTISGGKLVATSVAFAVGATQNINYVANTSVFISVDITVTSGTIEVWLGGTALIEYQVISATSSGTYTWSGSTAGSDGTLYIRSLSAGTTGTVDNISVFETDGTDVVHRMPKGWKPKDVFEDGLLQREGAANDYEVVYDGFDYYVKPAVAPSATTQTCVIGVKA